MSTAYSFEKSHSQLNVGFCSLTLMLPILVLSVRPQKQQNKRQTKQASQNEMILATIGLRTLEILLVGKALRWPLPSSD
jgi:hypothetical protein